MELSFGSPNKENIQERREGERAQEAQPQRHKNTNWGQLGCQRAKKNKEKHVLAENSLLEDYVYH